MKRRQGLLIAVLVILSVRSLSGAESPRPATANSVAPDASELMRQAYEIWQVKKDFNGALAKFNEAVEAAPDDADVRLRRGGFFETVSEMVIAEQKDKFKALASEDYRWVASAEPDSIRGGVARDGLTRLAGTALLEPKPETCPKEAAEARKRASELYATHRPTEALPQIEKAVKACPNAASYWVAYADMHFMLEDYDKAKELFTKALTIDPWSRTAHRFLADTEARLENADAVIRELELTVISDPGYEAGWAALRTYAGELGRKWNRVYSDKTSVTKTTKEGKDQTQVTLPKEVKSESLWLAYGTVKAGILEGSIFEPDDSGHPVKRTVDPKGMSALDIERATVKSTLRIAREIAANNPEKRAGAFWSMIARAADAGYLDEAIFLHLLDAQLAAEYPTFREKNAARLLSYVDTLIVPKP